MTTWCLQTKTVDVRIFPLQIKKMQVNKVMKETDDKGLIRMDTELSLSAIMLVFFFFFFNSRH